MSEVCEDCLLLKSLFSVSSLLSLWISVFPSALSLAFFISTIDIVWTATTSWFRLEVKWFYMTSRKRCQVEQPPSTHVTYLFTYSLSPPSLLTPLRDLFFSSLVASNIARDDLVMNKYRYYALMLMTQHLLSMANVIRG